MNSLSCPRCRSINAAGETFCTQCGATLNATTAGASSPIMQGRTLPADRLCSRCGELNPVIEAFCSRCSAPMQPGQPTSRPQPVSAPPQAVGASRGKLWGIVAVCAAILALFIFIQVSKARQEEQLLEAALRQADQRQNAIPPYTGDIPSPGQTVMQPAVPYTAPAYPSTGEMGAGSRPLSESNNNPSAEVVEQIRKQQEEMQRQACVTWHRQHQFLIRQFWQLTEKRSMESIGGRSIVEIQTQINAVEDQLRLQGDPPAGCSSTNPPL